MSFLVTLESRNIKIHIQLFTRKKGFIENAFLYKFVLKYIYFLHIQKTYLTL